MSLRGRIILFVSAAVVALTLGLIAAAHWRESTQQALAHRAAASAAERLWTKVVEKTAAEIVERLDVGLSRLPDLGEALIKRPDAAQMAALGERLSTAMAGDAAADLHIFDLRGDLLYAATGPAARPGADPGLIARMAELKLRPRGVELTAAGPALAVAQPVMRGDAMVGAAVYLHDLKPALMEFSGALDAHSFLLGPDGALVASSGGAALWAKLSPDALNPDRAASIRVDDRVWSVVFAPIPGLNGTRFGLLVAALDVTDARAAASVAEAVTIALAAALAAVILVVLHAYLNRQFEPLTSALRSMRALRFGDTSVEIAGLGRSDEIGLVADAVKAMRDHTETSILASERRERARLRQMRLIRNRMSAMAETLDEEARREVMADLARIERQAAAGHGQVDALAAAMQVMTDRVASQRRSLDAMVAELRDSLAAKTALEELREQMSFAGKLRESILPRGFPPRADLAAAGRLDAAEAFAGEFYDFVTLDDGRVAVILGAVGGEGLPAAFLAVSARTLARDGVLFGLSPARCLARVNLLLLADNRDRLPVALALGTLDPASGMFVYAAGGYPPPTLIARLGEASELSAPQGKPLGLEREAVFEDAAVETPSRAALVFVGPGALESPDASGDRFGKARALATLKDAVDLDPGALVDQTATAVAGFAVPPRRRDATCVALRWLGPTAA